MAVRFVIMLVFAILMTLFAVQNAGAVTINVIFASFQISQALVILVSVLIGAVMGLLLSMVKQVKSNMQLKNLQKSHTKLEEEKALLQSTLDQQSGTATGPAGSQVDAKSTEKQTTLNPKDLENEKSEELEAEGMEKPLR